MTKTLGKEGSFAEGPSNSPRQRFFWKKNPDNFFAEGQGAGPRQRVKKNSKKPFLCRGPALGKEFLKNPENFFAEGQGEGPRQRFLKKIKKFICRGSALGKHINTAMLKSCSECKLQILRLQ